MTQPRLREAAQGPAVALDGSSLSSVLSGLGSSMLDGVGGSMLDSALDSSTLGSVLDVRGSSTFGSTLDGSRLGLIALDGSTTLGSLLNQWPGRLEAWLSARWLDARLGARWPRWLDARLRCALDGSMLNQQYIYPLVDLSMSSTGSHSFVR